MLKIPKSTPSYQISQIDFPQTVKTKFSLFFGKEGRTWKGFFHDLFRGKLFDNRITLGDVLNGYADAGVFARKIALMDATKKTENIQTRIQTLIEKIEMLRSKSTLGSGNDIQPQQEEEDREKGASITPRSSEEDLSESLEKTEIIEPSALETNPADKAESVSDDGLKSPRGSFSDEEKKEVVALSAETPRELAADEDTTPAPTGPLETHSDIPASEIEKKKEFPKPLKDVINKILTEFLLNEDSEVFCMPGADSHPYESHFCRFTAEEAEKENFFGWENYAKHIEHIEKLKSINQSEMVTDKEINEIKNFIVKEYMRNYMTFISPMVDLIQKYDSQFSPEEAYLFDRSHFEKMSLAQLKELILAFELKVQEKFAFPPREYVESEEKLPKEKKSITDRLNNNLRDCITQQHNEEEGANFKLLVDSDSPENYLKKFGLASEEIVVGEKQVGLSSTQGKRGEMEDQEIAVQGSFHVSGNDYPFDLFGVFDGHGGSDASRFVKENITQALIASLEEHNKEGLNDEGVFNALKECFPKLRQAFLEEWLKKTKDLSIHSSGTTATVALVLNGNIWVANVGDSRTILVTEMGRTLQATEDAKPEAPNYKKKIERLGGTVTFNIFEGHRIGRELGVGRAIGDLGLKGVSPRPKITCLPLAKCRGGHLVLACDGLYDVTSTNRVGQFVFDHKHLSAKEISDQLVANAVKNLSRDNVSVLVVKL